MPWTFSITHKDTPPAGWRFARPEGAPEPAASGAENANDGQAPARHQQDGTDHHSDQN